jgi:signal transduction histidine kinase
VEINEQTVAALCDVGVAIGHGVARVELAEQLADAEAVASRIVSRAAHDLRGVTSTIGVVATALERRMANLDTDGQKQAMGILTHAAERLNALVTRLVDLSQLENGARPPYLESLPLAAALRDATDAVASETCVLDANLDEAIAVVADRTALDEILRALLDNAVRHGASHVSVTAARRAEHVDVLVTDDGPGIAPDHVPLLFQPFSRGPDAIGDGLGFSLAQSRVLARSCGGDLALRSDRPHETSFVLTLTGA